MIDRYKIKRIVEHMKLGEFEFDTFEVSEELDRILAFYGMSGIELNSDERALLMTELLPPAEQFEWSEAAKLASEDPLLAGIERKFSQKLEAIERRLAKEGQISAAGYLRMIALQMNMPLNIRVYFRSGKTQLLENIIPTESLRQQLKAKIRLGVIVNLEISRLQEMRQRQEAVREITTP